MEIEFYNEDLKKAYEINRERIEIDERHLTKVRIDIGTLEKYLRDNFKKFKETFSMDFHNCTIGLTKTSKHTKLRLAYSNENGEFEPIIDAITSRQLELYAHLPAFLYAITKHFYDIEQDKNHDWFNKRWIIYISAR